MAGINIGKGLKDLLQGASNAVQGAVDTVKTATKDVKLPEVKLPDIKLPDIKPEQLAGIFVKKPGDTNAADRESAISVLRIIYYFMAVDGQVFHSEEEKYDSIGRELDPEYEADKQQIIDACQAQMQKVIDPEDYYDVIQDGTEGAISGYTASKGAIIQPNMLVWDLLTIAYSDGNYNENERKLLKYIVRKLEIDKAVLLEMESSLLTLLDLEREEQWIKNTDRPYMTIETNVHEIENRKNTILAGVMDLINL